MSGNETNNSARIKAGAVIDGKYEILEVIGSGGMGTVYRAHHKFIHKDVAVKMLNPQLSGMEEVVKRFEREAMASARIEHPNICLVTDSGKAEDGQLYIVMELLHGRSLQQIIQEEAPLPLARIITISRQICSAISKAHGLKVIHRDLKPENVMVTVNDDGNESIKIMDFGIAKVTLDDIPSTPLTTAGMVFGTPSYISPEQASGDPADARSDLYSLGCMMFEMATGRTPYDSDTVGGILRKHVTAPVPDMLQPGTTAPPGSTQLADLVRQLMAKVPEERPASAAEVGNILEATEKNRMYDATVLGMPPVAGDEGETGSEPIAGYVKDITQSLVAMQFSRARDRTDNLLGERVVPLFVRLAAGVRKFPILIAALMLVILLGLAGMVAAVLVVSTVLSGDGAGERHAVAGRETPDDPLDPGVDGGILGTELSSPEAMRAFELAEKGKFEEALLLMEGLTTDPQMMKTPVFLSHLAFLRSKCSKHGEALDAVGLCINVKADCAKLQPLQGVLLAALRNRATSKRTAGYIALYGNNATLLQVENIARENKSKWLRKAAYNALKEGKHLEKLENWSRLAIQFVNGSMKCMARKQLLIKIREEGDPRAIPALDLFSSRTGCGFFRRSDCHKCFRQELQKTKSALLLK